MDTLDCVYIKSTTLDGVYLYTELSKDALQACVFIMDMYPHSITGCYLCRHMSDYVVVDLKTYNLAKLVDGKAHFNTAIWSMPSIESLIMKDHILAGFISQYDEYVANPAIVSVIKKLFTSNDTTAAYYVINYDNATTHRITKTTLRNLKLMMYVVENHRSMFGGRNHCYGICVNECRNMTVINEETFNCLKALIGNKTIDESICRVVECGAPNVERMAMKQKSQRVRDELKHHITAYDYAIHQDCGPNTG